MPGDDAETIVVRQGECLWSLSARSLGPRATTAEVAAAWPRWWAANRDLIGADPDVLHPGERLRVPALSERNAS
jgi:nucleoid-associated protein YgaU